MWVQEHRFEFDEAPRVEAVAAQLSRLALKFNGYDAPGEQGEGENQGGLTMSRPVGVALLMAGIDCGDRPVLYHLDPSGEAWVMAYKRGGARAARCLRSCSLKSEYFVRIKHVGERSRHVMAHAGSGSSVLLLFPPCSRMQNASIWWAGAELLTGSPVNSSCVF